MSDGAAEAADQEALDERNTQGDRDDRDERLQQVLRLGAAGFGRAEIAKALRMCPEALDQREAEDPRLATALRGAAGLSQAWWEALAREACANGRFSLAAWSREMRRRFGEDGPGAGGKAGSPKTGSPKANRWLRGERPRVTYLIPCNGMTKLNPDGTCPCEACQRGDPVYDPDDELEGELGDEVEDELGDDLANDDVMENDE